MKPKTKERLRVGRSGPVSRRVARTITRVAPVRKVDWLAYGVIGRPRGRDQRARVRRYGAWFELDLADDVDRMLYLDTYERLALRHVIALIGPGDLVVDVGANIGLYALAAAARGATVHAFEPVPRTADRLERNIALNPQLAELITVHRCGVSDQAGEMQLFAQDLKAYSGHASAYGDGAESVTVPTVTLDQALDPVGSVRLMKVDVEGHEPRVLAGARGFFERSAPDFLFVEAEDELLRRGGSSADELLATVRELGYRELGGYSLHHGLWPQRTPQPTSPPYPSGIAQSVLCRSQSPSPEPAGV